MICFRSWFHIFWSIRLRWCIFWYLVWSKKHIKPRLWIDLEPYFFHLVEVCRICCSIIISEKKAWYHDARSSPCVGNSPRMEVDSRSSQFDSLRLKCNVGLSRPITFLISWGLGHYGCMCMDQKMASYYRQHKESNITGFGWFWRIVQNLWAFKCSGFPEFRIKKQIHLIHDEPGMTHEWKNNHAGAYELTRTQSVHNRRVPYLLFSQPEKRWKSICNVSSSNPSRSVDSVDLVNPLDQPRAHADGNSQAARQQWPNTAGPKSCTTHCW